MARAPRPAYPCAVYHVTARGNNRAAIFTDDRDRDSLLALFAEAVKRFNLEIFAFCLMTNHFHLFLRTPEANISRALQWINSVYTQRYNRRHRRLGHLFQGRFKSVLVIEQAHWIHLSHYIHLNPVRAGLAADPSEHPWSSYADYVGANAEFPWLSPEPVLLAYGPDRAARRKRYRAKSLSLAGTGRESWKKFAADLFAAAPSCAAGEGGPSIKEPLYIKGKPNPRLAASARPPVDHDEALEQVAAAFAVNKDELFRKRRNFPARLAAYYHLTYNRGLSVASTAAALSVSPVSVSTGLIKLRQLMEEKPWLKAKIQSLNN